MEEKHWIEWIELVAGSTVYRRDLRAVDAPEAIFLTDAAEVIARAYCNLHGLWRS
jgi:superoxide reductase